MFGPWFTTPWRLTSQSHRAVAWRFWSPFPSHFEFPYATSRHRPIPSVPWTPYPDWVLCVPSHTPFSVPSPFPIIPCLYPTGPPATLWRGPTGSSSIRGPFLAPSTGRSLPVPAPYSCAAAPAYSPGLLCGPIRSLVPCLYPTWPPATLWRGPTGSSSIRGPFRAPSMGRSPPAPAPYSCAASHAVLVPWGRRLALATRPSLSRPLFPAARVFFLGRLQPSGAGALGPLLSRVQFVSLALVAPFSPPSACVVSSPQDPWWVPLPGLCAPRYPRLSPKSFTRPCSYCSSQLLFFFAPPAVPRLPVLLRPVPPLPARCVPHALLWRCGVLFPFFFPVLSAAWFPPPCMHTQQHCTAICLGSVWCSRRYPSPSRGAALGGPRPCQVGAPPSRPSHLCLR